MAEQRYQIREKIGRGGLGDVYVAYDTQLGREVALKRLRPNGRDVGDSDLLKEAKVLSSLQHPNIVTLYDVGPDAEGPFAVMELLKGETLDRTVERGALTFEDFRNVVTQTLEGMIAAQSAGLLHRDVKPTNIMVIWLPSGKFQIKILDFGLAKFSRQPTEQTSDIGDGIMGSIYFMAPEQFERLPLDPRTDMYSLGCVYYHSLTQRHPFEGDSAPQVMASHLRHDVRELGDLRPDLPEGVTTWVMWMINRQMEDRPADARQALEIFQHVLADYERSRTTSVPAAPTFQPRPATRPVLLAGAQPAAGVGGRIAPPTVRVPGSEEAAPQHPGGSPWAPPSPAVPYGAPGFR
ncbi:MAG TPA: protein kinase, partial [Longimicrobiaceae bacterium]|nr:protein kinase [Longimicrobiaceae bacterium]